ncbi:MAG: rhodanese-like domain-containing protein [Betaproteobacteria bacterium]|nr:rhodanese-like domain-containing protein [Betaproteobacteria bacterium]
MGVLDFLIQHVALVALVLASGVMLIWPEVQSLISREKMISTLEATQLINQRRALIIDLRSREHFDLGHMPMAHSIHLDELSQQAKNLSTDNPVILVASAQNTGRAKETLNSMGFKEVFVLKGGMTAWVEANLPLSHSQS